MTKRDRETDGESQRRNEGARQIDQHSHHWLWLSECLSTSRPRCMYTCTYTEIHVCVCAHLHACKHTRTLTYVYSVYIYIYTYLSSSILMRAHVAMGKRKIYPMPHCSTCPCIVSYIYMTLLAYCYHNLTACHAHLVSTENLS